MSSSIEIMKYEPFSNKRMVAYSLNTVILSLMWSIRNWIQLYAAKAMGIPILYVLFVFGLYVVWDAFNDPLAGNLLDRNTKFTSKYGKRFPFIVIGIIGACLCLTLLYIPVSFDPLTAAFWILFIIILYDAFQTMYELSVHSLTVDMFRDQEQRVKLSTFSHIIAGIGSISIWIVIPALLGRFGGETNPRAYFFMALFIILIILIMSVPHIWSVREPEEMKRLRSKLNVEGKSASPPQEVIIRAFKDRNWVGFIIAYVTWIVEIGCVTVGLSFYLVDGLGLPISMVGLPVVAFLLVGFGVVPVWMKIAKQLGLKKSYFYALLLTAISTASIIFATNYTLLVILAALGGIGHGGQGVILQAIYSEAIDKATLKSGKREESSYVGIMRFFSATAIFWQVLIFAIVGTITGYDPQLGTKNSDFAKLGLILQMSLIPATLMFISSFIFFKLYTITKEIAIENKHKLIEMDL
ncbi:MAG: MFS transporter [Promethearchaeota archaeon]|nr:MAG: MFS transporter [Candidatus Lokiarchaeota archaeon]